MEITEELIRQLVVEVVEKTLIEETSTTTEVHEEEAVTPTDSNASEIEAVEVIETVTKKVEIVEEEVVTPTDSNTSETEAVEVIEEEVVISADENISKMETTEEVIVSTPADVNITHPGE